jgi:hypothetical protein
MKDKKLVISMKHNMKVELPLIHDAATNEWVMRLPEETLSDITKYLESAWYALDEKSTIRIVNHS